ncbi:2-amino-4-hydroxy-6-hydroxymethyldihydropteridine diphosphokinase [Epilithonimonas mollis]|uniref:2-amino-4-hydroxy-6-hydroxymethyldihydropteridine pyrophosphokinase n=1 Tax=Epilithonimonas mollis TaxID=216903 RepID=A0A1M6PBI5_9FLAO|nr:2-amino-4-hydroxy-6-hydroxymethyldihydropteridine diphosphokinase [Epilithonimonas mollis]SHK05303.1 2-amino-4-hydroxy-6-hydroxymethyldihydropteridinediphosphokinase [Epilithonimonas mollis]
MSYNEAVLLLGSNINNPEKNIENALEKIEINVGSILMKSKLILTKPVEFESNKIFCNIAVRLKTQISPVKLLFELKQIEKQMGRIFDSADLGAYQDRVIDIDIIMFNNIKFVSDKLIIPHHKNLYERDFASEIINNVR